MDCTKIINFNVSNEILVVVKHQNFNLLAHRWESDTTTCFRYVMTTAIPLESLNVITDFWEESYFNCSFARQKFPAF